MRAKIIGTKEVFEVICEEFSIEGSDEKFIVHASINYWNKSFTATHLATSQVIGDGDTIDEAIVNGREKWLSASPALLVEKLAERRAWVAERVQSLGAQP